MNNPRLASLSGFILLAAALPLTGLRAGDDAAPAKPANPTPTAQMNDYLQGQKVTHTVETTGGDFKGGGAEVVTVKIYGVATDTLQDSICTALAATAKKSHVKEATVLFFTMTQAAAQAATFQPSRLPGGNGEVEFARDTTASAYRLQRTVKL